MALANYGELVEELESFLNRTDLTPRIPTFIALFEARMNRILRVPDMEATSYAPATEERIDLPADFLSLRELRVDGYSIPPFAPQDLHETFRTSSGMVQGYSIQGLELLLLPAPSDSEVRISYYQRIPALTESNPTNWLLTKHPDAYLYGVLCEAKAHIVDTDLALSWKLAWDEVLSEMQLAGVKASLPATPLAARPPVFE